MLGSQFSEPPVAVGGGFPNIAVDVFVGDATATEGLDLVFDVVLSKEPANPVTVTLSTADGSASGGIDYNGGTYSVTITPPATTGTITIATQSDTDINELSENFTVSIDSASGTAVQIGAISDTGIGTVLDSYVDDNVLGLITTAAADSCPSIGTGTSCTFTANWVVGTASPNPLVNNVVALYHPDGFPNQITATATHSLNVLLPADLALTKTLNTPPPYAIGQQVEYTITITNNGPGEANDVTVNDVTVGLGGMTITAVNNPSADPGDCSAGNSFPCSIAGMADQEAVTLTTTGTIQ